jgi:hypothetical protein
MKKFSSKILQFFEHFLVNSKANEPTLQYLLVRTKILKSVISALVLLFMAVFFNLSFG